MESTQPKKRGRPLKKQDGNIVKENKEKETEPKTQFDFSTLSSSTCEKLLSIAKTGFPSEIQTQTGFPSQVQTGFPSQVQTGFPSEVQTGFQPLANSTQSTVFSGFAPTSPTYSPPRSPKDNRSKSPPRFLPTSPTENYPQSPLRNPLAVSDIPPPNFSDFRNLGQPQNPNSSPSEGRGHYIHPERQGIHGSRQQTGHNNVQSFQSQPQHFSQFPSRGRGSFSNQDRGTSIHSQRPPPQTQHPYQQPQPQYQQSQPQQYNNSNKPRNNSFTDPSNTKIIALERQLASLQNDVISTRGEMESMKFRLMAAEKKIQAIMENK